MAATRIPCFPVGGQHHDLELGVGSFELPGGLNAVAVGQLVIHEHHVGVVVVHDRDQCGHVSGDSDHVDVGLNGQHRG
ncbi:MAG: hypothetical protein M3083_01235 [Actinomycetota bacterium]|nr:hypothetical protein [Actinomycetota bacterium]